MLVTEERGTVNKDRIEGSLKKAEGKLTGDKVREQQGKAQGARGKAYDKAGDLKEKVRGKTSDR